MARQRGLEADAFISSGLITACEAWPLLLIIILHRFLRTRSLELYRWARRNNVVQNSYLGRLANHFPTFLWLGSLGKAWRRALQAMRCGTEDLDTTSLNLIITLIERSSQWRRAARLLSP